MTMKIQLDESQVKRAIADYLCRVLRCDPAPKIASMKIRRKAGINEQVGSVVVEIEEET